MGGFELANVILNKSLRKLAKLSLVFGTPRFGGLEASIGGKWLELLSEIAPGLKRAAIMFNPDTAPASAFVTSFETAARSLKVVPTIAAVHSDVEIETAI